MDILGGLRKLLGIGTETKGIAQPAAPNVQARQYQPAQRKGAEDDVLVDTPQGRMPLSSVNMGQPWQNPDNGYSPMGYSQRNQSSTDAINGAINPLSNPSGLPGQATFYRPGGGPRPQQALPAFDEILKRLR